MLKFQAPISRSLVCRRLLSGDLITEFWLQFAKGVEKGVKDFAQNVETLVDRVVSGDLALKLTQDADKLVSGFICHFEVWCTCYRQKLNVGWAESEALDSLNACGMGGWYYLGYTNLQHINTVRPSGKYVIYFPSCVLLHGGKYPGLIMYKQASHRVLQRTLYRVMSTPSILHTFLNVCRKFVRTRK